MGPGALPVQPPQQPPPVCSPVASCPPLRPTPHQVQCRTAAQILHDDPQLRALGPEKHPSARGREQRGTAQPGPQDTHSPAGVTRASGPSGTHHKRAPAVPSSSPPINTTTLQTDQWLTPHQKSDREDGSPSQHSASTYQHSKHPFPPWAGLPGAGTGLWLQRSQSAPGRAPRRCPMGAAPALGDVHSQAMGHHGHFRANQTPLTSYTSPWPLGWLF